MLSAEIVGDQMHDYISYECVMSMCLAATVAPGFSVVRVVAVLVAMGLGRARQDPAATVVAVKTIMASQFSKNALEKAARRHILRCQRLPSSTHSLCRG